MNLRTLILCSLFLVSCAKPNGNTDRAVTYGGTIFSNWNCDNASVLDLTGHQFDKYYSLSWENATCQEIVWGNNASTIKGRLGLVSCTGYGATSHYFEYTVDGVTLTLWEKDAYRPFVHCSINAAP